MPLLLGPQAYPAVRAAIQVDLTANDLPDAVIALDQYAAEAERQVLALAANLAPDVTVAPGSDGWRQLVSAAALLCASLVVAAIPQLSSEAFAAYRYTRVPLDPIKMASALRMRAVALVSAAVQISVVQFLLAARPSVMIMAPGGRGDISPRPFHSSSQGTDFLGPF